MTAGHKRDAGGCAGGLGVHSGQAHSLPGELIDARRLVAANSIECLVAEITKPDVIDQDVENIGRLAAVFLAKFGEALVQAFVFQCPGLAVLLFQDVILGVMYKGLGHGDLAV